MKTVERPETPITKTEMDSIEPIKKNALLSQSPLVALIIIAVSIFALEALVMLLLSSFPPFHSWREAVADAGLLVVLLSPTLYLFLFRPLAKHIAERGKTEKQLREARDQLEKRVQERTAQLVKANEDLGQEIEERRRTESELEKRSHDLNNRVKELNCLIGISRVRERPGITLKELLQEVVNLLPQAWQYPETSCSCIILEGKAYISKNCKETDWKQTSDIVVSGKPVGEVQICYLEERPDSDEGPFLKEERSLINAVAETLGNLIETAQAREQLSWESDVNEALSELYVPLISSSSSDQEIAAIILEQGKRLTKSEHGYVSSLDPKTSHSMGHTLSEMMKKIGKLSEKQAESFSANSQETDSSLQTFKDKKTPSKRLLSVPVMLGEQLVGQIALSDKKEDYTQRDLEAVRRLAYFYALAIQRKWAEDALQQAHDTLERRVEERTRELVESNVRLIREIEEHRRTEEQLLRAKETLQSVFDGISDPLVMLDNDLSIVMLNEAAKKFYQVDDHKELFGKVCYEAMKEGSKPCEGCEVPRAIETGKIKMFERKGFMDPERLENVVVYPIKRKTESGSDAILHIRDITDQKLFEKQLIQSEKLASLGLLVSSIAHEINNPNSFITFNTPILRDYLEELMPIVDTYAEQRPDFELFHMPYSEFREDLYNLLDNIEHGATRINSVVAHLREFSRGKDRREEKWIDLKSVVDKSLAMCETKVRKTVKSFVKDIPGDLSNIYSDPHALEQILINLLLNAAQASDKKDSRVALSVAAGNTWRDKTIIQVSDNGRGMDSKTREHIFDPFFSTKARSDGTGLGLYITHNLVSSLRGRIEVESQQGEGSIFKVILPDKERRKEKRE